MCGLQLRSPNGRLPQFKLPSGGTPLLLAAQPKKDAESSYCQPSSDNSGPERDQVTQESKSVGLIYGQE
jgi:hypothetical protein